MNSRRSSDVGAVRARSARSRSPGRRKTLGEIQTNTTKQVSGIKIKSPHVEGGTSRATRSPAQKPRDLAASLDEIDDLFQALDGRSTPGTASTRTSMSSRRSSMTASQILKLDGHSGDDATVTMNEIQEALFRRQSSSSGRSSISQFSSTSSSNGSAKSARRYRVTSTPPSETSRGELSKLLDDLFENVDTASATPSSVGTKRTDDSLQSTPHSTLSSNNTRNTTFAADSPRTAAADEPVYATPPSAGIETRNARFTDGPTRDELQMLHSAAKPSHRTKTPARSCLSARKQPLSAVSQRKGVIFGSPRCAEFNKSSPITSMTPLPADKTKHMFSVGQQIQPFPSLREVDENDMDEETDGASSRGGTDRRSSFDSDDEPITRGNTDALSQWEDAAGKATPEAAAVMGDSASSSPGRRRCGAGSATRSGGSSAASSKSSARRASFGIKARAASPTTMEEAIAFAELPDLEDAVAAASAAKSSVSGASSKRKFSPASGAAGASPSVKQGREKLQKSKGDSEDEAEDGMDDSMPVATKLSFTVYSDASDEEQQDTVAVKATTPATSVAAENESEEIDDAGSWGSDAAAEVLAEEADASMDSDVGGSDDDEMVSDQETDDAEEEEEAAFSTGTHRITTTSPVEGKRDAVVPSPMAVDANVDVEDSRDVSDEENVDDEDEDDGIEAVAARGAGLMAAIEEAATESPAAKQLDREQRVPTPLRRSPRLQRANTPVQSDVEEETAAEHVEESAPLLTAKPPRRRVSLLNEQTASTTTSVTNTPTALPPKSPASTRRKRRSALESTPTRTSVAARSPSPRRSPRLAAASSPAPTTGTNAFASLLPEPSPTPAKRRNRRRRASVGGAHHERSTATTTSRNRRASVGFFSQSSVVTSKPREPVASAQHPVLEEVHEEEVEEQVAPSPVQEAVDEEMPAASPASSSASSAFAGQEEDATADAGMLHDLLRAVSGKSTAEAGHGAEEGYNIYDDDEEAGDDTIHMAIAGRPSLESLPSELGDMTVDADQLAAFFNTSSGRSSSVGSSDDDQADGSRILSSSAGSSSVHGKSTQKESVCSASSDENQVTAVAPVAPVAQPATPPQPVATRTSSSRTSATRRSSRLSSTPKSNGLSSTGRRRSRRLSGAEPEISLEDAESERSPSAPTSAASRRRQTSPLTGGSTRRSGTPRSMGQRSTRSTLSGRMSEVDENATASSSAIRGLFANDGSMEDDTILNGLARSGCSHDDDGRQGDDTVFNASELNATEAEAQATHNTSQAASSVSMSVAGTPSDSMLGSQESIDENERMRGDQSLMNAMFGSDNTSTTSTATASQPTRTTTTTPPKAAKATFNTATFSPAPIDSSVSSAGSPDDHLGQSHSSFRVGGTAPGAGRFSMLRVRDSDEEDEDEDMEEATMHSVGNVLAAAAAATASAAAARSLGASHASVSTVGSHAGGDDDTTTLSLNGSTGFTEEFRIGLQQPAQAGRPSLAPPPQSLGALLQEEDSRLGASNVSHASDNSAAPATDDLTMELGTLGQLLEEEPATAHAEARLRHSMGGATSNSLVDDSMELTEQLAVPIQVNQQQHPSWTMDSVDAHADGDEDMLDGEAEEDRQGDDGSEDNQSYASPLSVEADAWAAEQSVLSACGLTPKSTAARSATKSRVFHDSPAVAETAAEEDEEEVPLARQLDLNVSDSSAEPVDTDMLQDDAEAEAGAEAPVPTPTLVVAAADQDIHMEEDNIDDGPTHISSEATSVAKSRKSRHSDSSAASDTLFLLSPESTSAGPSAQGQAPRMTSGIASTSRAILEAPASVAPRSRHQSSLQSMSSARHRRSSLAHSMTTSTTASQYRRQRRQSLQQPRTPSASLNQLQQKLAALQRSEVKQRLSLSGAHGVGGVDADARAIEAPARAFGVATPSSNRRTSSFTPASSKRGATTRTTPGTSKTPLSVPPTPMVVVEGLVDVDQTVQASTLDAEAFLAAAELDFAAPAAPSTTGSAQAGAASNLLRDVMQATTASLTLPSDDLADMAVYHDTDVCKTTFHEYLAMLMHSPELGGLQWATEEMNRVYQQQSVGTAQAHARVATEGTEMVQKVVRARAILSRESQLDEAGASTHDPRRASAEELASSRTLMADLQSLQHTLHCEARASMDTWRAEIVEALCGVLTNHKSVVEADVVGLTTVVEQHKQALADVRAAIDMHEARHQQLAAMQVYRATLPALVSEREELHTSNEELRQTMDTLQQEQSALDAEEEALLAELQSVHEGLAEFNQTPEQRAELLKQRVTELKVAQTQYMVLQAATGWHVEGPSSSPAGSDAVSLTYQHADGSTHKARWTQTAGGNMAGDGLEFTFHAGQDVKHSTDPVSARLAQSLLLAACDQQLQRQCDSSSITSGAHVREQLTAAGNMFRAAARMHQQLLQAQQSGVQIHIVPSSSATAAVKATFVLSGTTASAGELESIATNAITAAGLRVRRAIVTVDLAPATGCTSGIPDGVEVVWSFGAHDRSAEMKIALSQAMSVEECIRAATQAMLEE